MVAQLQAAIEQKYKRIRQQLLQNEENPVAASAVAQPEAGSLPSAVGADSAEQPASGTEERFDELQTWFDSLGEDVGQHQAEINRLREAYNVCRNKASHASLRELSSAWQPPMKKDGKI